MKLSPADAARFRVALAGWGFGVGTLTVIAPNFSLADPGIFLAAVLILRHRRPPVWAALLFGSVALGVIWSANPVATALTAARVLALAVVGSWLVRNWDARSFAAGLVAAWAIQVPHMALGIIDPGQSWVSGGRQVGLTRYATLLGTGAYFVHMAIPKSGRVWVSLTWAIAAVALAASGARAPAGALGVHALASLSIRNLLITGATGLLFVGAMYQANTVGRAFSLGQIATDIEIRIATAAPDKVSSERRDYVYHIPGPVTQTPGGELVATVPGSEYTGGGALIPVGVSRWRAQGVGAGAYLDANPWPRPHNIYSIAWHELGVFSAVPVGLFVWALYRRRLTVAAAVSLAALGLLDDTVASQAEGHFILAGVLVLSAVASRSVTALIVASTAATGRR